MIQPGGVFEGVWHMYRIDAGYCRTGVFTLFALSAWALWSLDTQRCACFRAQQTVSSSVDLMGSSCVQTNVTIASYIVSASDLPGARTGFLEFGCLAALSCHCEGISAVG